MIKDDVLDKMALVILFQIAKLISWLARSIRKEMFCLLAFSHRFQFLLLCSMKRKELKNWKNEKPFELSAFSLQHFQSLKGNLTRCLLWSVKF